MTEVGGTLDREHVTFHVWDGGDRVEDFMVGPMNTEAICIITGIDVPGDLWWRIVRSEVIGGIQ